MYTPRRSYHLSVPPTTLLLDIMAPPPPLDTETETRLVLVDNTSYTARQPYRPSISPTSLPSDTSPVSSSSLDIVTGTLVLVILAAAGFNHVPVFMVLRFVYDHFLPSPYPLAVEKDWLDSFRFKDFPGLCQLEQRSLREQNERWHAGRRQYWRDRKQGRRDREQHRQAREEGRQVRKEHWQEYWRVFEEHRQVWDEQQKDQDQQQRDQDEQRRDEDDQRTHQGSEGHVSLLTEIPGTIDV